MSRKSKRFLIVLALLAAAVTVLAVLNAGRVERTTVHTAVAERVQELKSIVSASGEIQPKESVDIQAEIAGVIIELPVEEGDVVEKGQILLKIDPISTAAQTAAARAAYHAAEAEARGQAVQIAMAEANLARDEYLLKSSELERTQSEANHRRSVDNLERKKALYERQLLSAEDLDIASTGVDVAKAALDAAGAPRTSSRRRRSTPRSGASSASSTWRSGSGPCPASSRTRRPRS
jgi:HlyD family secretion protein